MQMNKKGAILRGALYVLIAVIAAVLEDQYLRDHMPLWALSLLKISGAGLGAWRIYIDTSHGDSQKQEEPAAPESAPYAPTSGQKWPSVDADDTEAA